MEKRQKKTAVCPKCGWKNPKEAVFCLKCGSKLEVAEVAERTPLEALVFLHIVGSLYTIFTVAFNSIVRESPLLLPLYLASGFLGLCAAYVFHQRRVGKWGRILLSLGATALGFIGTSLLFYIGGGLWPPTWVIFLITGLKLGLDRRCI